MENDGRRQRGLGLEELLAVEEKDLVSDQGGCRRGWSGRRSTRRGWLLGSINVEEGSVAEGRNADVEGEELDGAGHEEMVDESARGCSREGKRKRYARGGGGAEG